MTIHKCYLIEPRKATIRTVSVESDNSLGDMRKLLDCDLIDMVRFDHKHHIVIDDEGLMQGNLPYFCELDDYNSPLAGNLLITGYDHLGNMADVDLPIEDVASKITIVKPFFEIIFDAIEDNNNFGYAVSGIKMIVEKQAPEMIEERA